MQARDFNSCSDESIVACAQRVGIIVFEEENSWCVSLKSFLEHCRWEIKTSLFFFFLLCVCGELERAMFWKMAEAAPGAGAWGGGQAVTEEERGPGLATGVRNVQS